LSNSSSKSHLYRVTKTRCRIGMVFSPDDVHIVARNMYRKAINIIRKIVHQVGSIYKKNTCLIVKGCRDGAVSISRPKSARFLFVGLDEERNVQNKGGYTRRIALLQYGCCC